VPDRQRRSYPMILEPVISVCTASLLAIGLIMVASSSMVVSEHYFDTPFHFLIRYSVYLTLSLAASFLILRTDTQFYYRLSGYLLLAAFVLLIAVFLPGISHKANGSIRWLKLGPITLQVSEVVKLCFIIYLAGFLTRHHQAFQHDFKCFIRPIILLTLASLLLLSEPDFGAVAILFCTTFGLIFLGGSRLWYFGFFSLGAALGFVLLIVMAPYRLQRISAFLHPWSKQFGSGYQLTQSLMAFGHGGVWGQGLGNSVQKLYYLPEAHTDFVFPVLAEELGLVGAIIVLGLYFILTWRIVQISQNALMAQQYFEGYLAGGIGIWLGIQALINIAVTTGLLPTKGLTLPLISYGGTSLLFNCVAVVMVLRIHYQMVQQQTKHQHNRNKVAML